MQMSVCFLEKKDVLSLPNVSLHSSLILNYWWIHCFVDYVCGNSWRNCRKCWKYNCKFERAAVSFIMPEACRKKKMSHDMTKRVFGSFPPGQTQTGLHSHRSYVEFWNLAIKFRDIILSKQRTTKVLIRLRGCAGWYVPLLFTYDIRHIISWPGSNVKYSIPWGNSCKTSF